MIEPADDIEDQLQQLNTWFQSNPKLPNQIHPTVLKRFLKCANMNMDDARKLIEYNYQLRGRSSNVFFDRDPSNDVTSKCSLNVDRAPLPGLTPDHYKVICYRIANGDASAQNCLEEMRCFYMMHDARFRYSDAREIDDDNDNDTEDVKMDALALGEIQVFDIGKYTLRHMTSVPYRLMRDHMTYMQEAYPLPLKCVHVINCPSFLSTMMSICKPFMREEVLQKYIFHTNGIESLYDHLPREMLPSDYGGNGPTVSEISANWWDIVVKNKAYLLDSNYWDVPKEPEPKRWFLW